MASNHKPAVRGGGFFKSFGIAACAAALIGATAVADPVDWTKYERSFNITFPGYAGSEALENFPVLIRLSAELNDFQYNKCKSPNGGDLRFSDAEGNLLASEVDTWDPSGESLVWVRVPSLTAATKITAHYCCSSPATVNPKDVWSNGYVGVWHLGESARPLRTSTAVGSDFTVSSTQSGHEGSFDSRLGFATNGVLGKAVAFDLGTDRMGGLYALDPDHVYDGLGEVTIEFWTCKRANDDERGRNLLCKYNGDFAYMITDQNSDHRFACQFKDDAGGGASVNPNKSDGITTLDTWNHSAYVCNLTNATGAVYLNTVSCINNAKDIKTTSRMMTMNAPLSLGNRDSSSAYAFPGIIDELRISNVARSRDWCKATYDTVMNESFAYYEMDNDWGRYTHKFNISFNGAPETALADFPVLVKLAEYDETEGTGITNFRYGDCSKPNGGDLRFSDENGHLLDHEIDTWDETGVSCVWVKVPALSSATKITAYYGWRFAPAVNSKAVWSNGYLGVWHLNESARPLRDSTTNAIHFTRSNRYQNGNEYDDCATFGQTDSAVGRSVKFNPNVEGKENKGGLVAPDDSGKLNGLDAMTIEIWANPEAIESTSRYMLGRRMGNNTVVDGVSVKYRGYQFEYSSKKPIATFYLENGQGNDSDYCQLKPSSTMSTDLAGQWNYHCASYDKNATSHTNYLNAAVAATAANSTGYAIHGSIPDPLCLGNDCQTSSTKVFNGALDELRISNVARSKEWVQATYDTIKNNATFTTYGAVRENIKGFILLIR